MWAEKENKKQEGDEGEEKER